MGILDRISMIVRSNVNSVLDKSSNPEADLNTFLYDLQDGIKQAEAAVQNAVVQQKVAEMNANDNRKRAQEWDAKAQIAVKANRDDLATEALRQKMNFEQEAEQLDQQAQEQKNMVAQLRTQVDELKQKYAETEQNKGNLIARYNMNRFSEKVMGTREPGQAIPNSDYNRMQQKIMAEQVRAEMDQQSVRAAAAEAELDHLQTEATLEDELASLKQRMGNKPASSTTSSSPSSSASAGTSDTKPADAASNADAANQDRPYEEK